MSKLSKSKTEAHIAAAMRVHDAYSWSTAEEAEQITAINNLRESGAGGQRMSKLQHTPGPWQIGTPPPNGEQTIGLNNGLMIAISTTGDNIDSKANARLIAAAPEMLDTLIMVKKYGHSGYVEGSKSDIEFWFKIDRTIEKATGMSIEEVISL